MLLLLVLVAVLPLFVAVKMMVDPVSRPRLTRFADRHALQVTPANQEVITKYLACTRRWRAVGVTCAYVLTIVSMLPDQRVAIEVVPLLAGWLGGALIAEIRFRTQSDSSDAGQSAGDVVPRWLLRVPVAIAVTAVGTTWLAAVVHSGGSEQILGWGMGALACAAAVAAANRFVESSSVGVGLELSMVARATKAHSMIAMTAVGSALMVFCMIRQLDVVGSGLFGQSAAAADGVATMWAIGAAVIAWVIRGAGQSAPAALQHRPMATARPVLQLAGVVAALVVGSVAWASDGLWRDHPPYDPAAIRATATIRLTDFERFDDDAHALGITDLNALLDRPGDQVFIGRVDFTVPPAAQGAGTYHVVVIDERSNTIAPMLFGKDGGGWNGFLHQVPKKYPWLSAMAPVPVNGGWTSPGSEVSVASDATSPISFVGKFHDTTISSPSELTVALIFTGPDQQIYWATRVPFGP